MSSVNLLNLDLPEDPVERLMYLSGVMRAVRSELDSEYQRAYFEARTRGQFDAALGLRLHSEKRALAWTRAENEARGRMMRWGDGR